MRNSTMGDGMTPDRTRPDREMADRGMPDRAMPGAPVAGGAVRAARVAGPRSAATARAREQAHTRVQAPPRPRDDPGAAPRERSRDMPGAGSGERPAEKPRERPAERPREGAADRPDRPDRKGDTPVAPGKDRPVPGHAVPGARAATTVAPQPPPWLRPRPEHEAQLLVLARAMGRRMRALRVRMRRDDGMTTAEYAVGTVAAVAFAAVLYKIVTGGAVSQALTGVITKTLRAPF